MEFMNRSAQQPAAPARAATNGGGTSAGGSSKKSMHWKESPGWLRVVWVVLLFSATILVVAMLTLLYFGGNKEADYVNTKSKQAVFLTNGQVYFGSIKQVNKDFIDLQDIYYLNVSQQVQPKDSKDTSQQNSISLVKLGCELHGPMDQMVINRDQVTFWENLKSSGQVSDAIAKWVKANPKGQTCQTSSNTTQP
jgi:hypothetical protein